MADGPTVVTTGNGAGTAIAIVLALVAIAFLLFFTGVLDFSGGSRDVDVKVDLPKVEVPAVPVPAPAAPAQGG